MEQERRDTSANEKDGKNESPNKDDSLTDFKSPKGQLAPVTILGKSDAAKNKRTKKFNSKCWTSDKKKEASLSAGRAPTSIESSFFKSTDSGQRDGHACPLCMKYFNDTHTGMAHTKSCAAKNKVSTSKLLAAVALQQRQADERRAIGLPAVPTSRANDNNYKRIHRASLKNDPDLELALALSKSLQENEAGRELEEAPVGDTIDSQPRRTLKNFGFSTNKPAASDTAPTKPRRKKHLGPTILQTRTQESRDRILSEKIAEILMGNEAITQIPHCEVNCTKKTWAVVPKSRLLNEICQTTKRLWESAGLSSDFTNFYVQDLVEFISSPDFDRQNLANLENKETDCERVSHQDRIETNNERSSREFYIETDNRVSEYRNTLQIDWANTLNVSAMSDVVVIAKNNHIWAHRLVLYVRCSDILLDCQPMNDSKFRHVKEKIEWPDVDYIAALAFLEFIYSGVIVKTECVFSDNDIFSAIGNLARKYRSKNLFEYMRERKSQIDKSTAELEGHKSGLKSPIIIQVNDRNFVNTSVATVNSAQDPEAVLKSNAYHPTIEETREHSSVATTANAGRICDTKPIENVSNVDSLRCRSISPDLFDDTSEEPMDIETNVRDVRNDDDSNLKILAQLISNDNLSSSVESDRSERSIISAATLIDDSSIDTSQDDDQAQRISEKPKSNLSVFIEKVGKINAKSVLDSYTEEDSLGISYVCAKRRNPFGINNESDISIFNTTREARTHDEQLTVENEAVNINVTSSIEPSELEDSNSLDNTVGSTDSDNLSIYSKYKRIHEHNGRKKYRNSLIKLTSESSAEISRDNDNSSALNDEAIDLTQESDTELESSPASSVVRFDRSRGNDRALVVSDSDSLFSGEPNERGEKILVGCKPATIQDESINIASPLAGSSNNGKYLGASPDINILSQSLTNSKMLNSSSRYSDGMDKSVFGTGNRAFDEFSPDDARYLADFEKEHDSPPPNEDGPSKGTKSLSHSSLYPELDVFQVDDRIFTQSVVTAQSPRCTNPSLSSPKSKANALHRKRRIDDGKGKEANFVNTPEKDHDVFCHDDNLIFAQSFKSPRVSPSRTLTPTPSYESNKKDSEIKESFRVSSPIVISSSPDMDTIRIDGFPTEIKEFNKENVCLVTDINNGPSLPFRNSPSPSNLEIATSLKAGPSRRRFSPDCTKATPTTTKNSLVRWKSMPTETSNTRSGLKRKTTPTKSSRSVLSQNVTPLKYDTMDTPELRVELDKYGIKPQKAHRARQLLTHIYNELYNKVPSTDSDAGQSSDADEPPVKKIGTNYNGTSDDSEPEREKITDDGNATSKITIEQAFTALINDNKELHNKILTYEPLPLELLHGMLTTRGFKCKLNDLMDFLDQQCITFQVQDQPRRHNAAKVRAKKTIGSRNQ